MPNAEPAPRGDSLTAPAGVDLVLTTLDRVPDRAVQADLGLVSGSVVLGRHLGRDIMAFVRSLLGGEITDYSRLLAEGREQAVARMAAEAEALGGDAVVCVRLSTNSISDGAAEVLAYGAAVRLAE